MFQTNTAREIFYIFLWLAGIILLYALVHTFILEPSEDKHTKIHNKPAVTQNAIHETQISTPSHKHTKIISTVIEKPIEIKKVVQDIVIKTATKQTATDTIEHAKTKETVKEVPTSTNPTHVSTPTVPKTLQTPDTTISIPSIPSVPSIPSNMKANEVVNSKIEIKTTQDTTELSTATEALKKELSQKEEIELIEKARQLVIEEAEATRAEAMKALGR